MFQEELQRRGREGEGLFYQVEVILSSVRHFGEEKEGEEVGEGGGEGEKGEVGGGEEEEVVGGGEEEKGEVEGGGEEEV